MSSKAKREIVESSVKIFAKEGYTHARVADIARSAEVNNAAINYHFQSKENLFVEVLRYSFEIANNKYPLTAGLSPESSGTDKVRAFAGALLSRSFDEGPAGDFNRIMCRTIHAPGAPIKRILAEVSVLELTTLESAFREIFPNITEKLLELAKINLINLATVISQKPYFQERLLGETPSTEEIENFITLQTDIVVASMAPLLDSMNMASTSSSDKAHQH